MISEVYTDLESTNGRMLSSVEIKVNETALELNNVTLPAYETQASAGMDVRAVITGLSTYVVLQPGERLLIKTGLFVAIPEGYEIQVRSRSGLAYKHGVVVLNSPGTIDADYRGEIGVILINHGHEPFTISNGDRIAQLVLNKVERIYWNAISVISTSDRGVGGFGSTGMK